MRRGAAFLLRPDAFLRHHAPALRGLGRRIGNARPTAAPGDEGSSSCVAFGSLPSGPVPQAGRDGGEAQPASPCSLAQHRNFIKTAPARLQYALRLPNSGLTWALAVRDGPTPRHQAVAARPLVLDPRPPAADRKNRPPSPISQRRAATAPAPSKRFQTPFPAASDTFSGRVRHLFRLRRKGSRHLIPPAGPLRPDIALAALPAALERRLVSPGDRYLGDLWLS
jgi:hypothetical protein